MNKSKIKKKIKAYSIVLFILGTLIFNVNLIHWNIVEKKSKSEKDSINDDDSYDFQVENLQTSDFQASFNGSGQDINITLHQSLIDTTTKQYTDLDTSNSFTEPFPIFSGYNTSFINITINNINAPNKTIDLELGTSFSDQLLYDLFTYSFTVRNTCILQNFSIYLSESGGSGGNVDIKFLLFNATYDSMDGRIEPHMNTGLIDITQTVPDEHLGQWYNFSINKELDVTNTYNNTFFIYFYQNTNTNFARGYYYYQTGSTTDDYLVYRDSGAGWQALARDISSQIIVGLSDNTPVPSEINLKVNGTLVNDLGTNNQGYYFSTQQFGGYDDKIDFEITADWWEVSCDVTHVQINYTKSDIIAYSEFSIPSSGQNVQWNVTNTGGLNYFDSRITDFNTINFTIPKTWLLNTIKVYNGTYEWLSTDINKDFIKDRYRHIQVLNAGNGTNWFLIANSTNLLSSIDTYIGMTSTNNFNFTDIAHFNANFSTEIINGIINLSVYSPALINDELNYSIKVESFTAGKVILLADWDISDNVTQYGDFRSYVFWNNGTDAGFLEKIITILGETDLIIEEPQSFTFNASTIFDITIFFKDIWQTKRENITGAEIQYKINNGPFMPVGQNITEIGYGRYNITIGCNDTDFTSHGPNSITINASKQYYNNQSKIINIIILGETSLTIISPLNGAAFDSSNTFNITVKYNNTIRIEIIDAPAINYSLDGGNNYRWDNIKSIGDNKYNITVNCNDTQFGNYGLQNIIINASKSYYYNQSEPLSITITGDTALTLTKWPDKSFYYSDESFIITANFNDTSRNQGLDGATIEVDVGGTPYTSIPTYIGNGNYNITIDCSDSIFGNYGVFNIRVNASKLNYYTKSDSLYPIVIGTTSLIIISPSDGSIYTTKQIFDIIIEYEDVVKSTGIPGAIIEYSLNGTSYRGDNVTDNNDGTYNIEVYAGHSDFDQFGFIDLIFNASKANYNNLSVSLTIHRQITTIITPSNTASLGPVMRGLNVSYTFDYSDTLGNPINEATWERISPSYDFITYLANNGDGDYTMHFNTSIVDVSGSPYTFVFNISAVGNETQVLSITIDVTIIHTNIVNLTWLSTIARHSGSNQSIMFYFNDTTNNQPVLNLATNDVEVRNNVTGSIWDTGDFNWSLNNPWNNGTYILDVSTNGLDAGWYTLEIRVSDVPNYEASYAYVTFYLRGNYADIGLISVSDPGGALTPLGPSNNFTFYVGSNINLEFNYTEAEFGGTIILGDADYYIVTYVNLDNSTINGILSNTFHFVYDTPSFGTHTGSLTTQNLAIGEYSIEILLVRKNYENTTKVFYATVKDKLDINISIHNMPEDGYVNAGDSFTISFLIELNDGTDWIPLSNVNVELIPFIDGNPVSSLFNNTNLGGYVYFEITIPKNAKNITLSVNVDSTFYYKSDSINVQGFTVIPFDTGLRLEDFMPYLIIIGAVAVTGIAAVSIYRGVVVPKKREKKRVLSEVRTIFDDAINLEHILVLYKNTGTCVFFKSFGSEKIDPELISGFISAVSSFGKEMVAQKALNEISYGDKMLLLADGEYTRVALVLSKNASLILRKHLTAFIGAFEKNYEKELPNWRGQLNFFRSAGSIVDDDFNTSIILPHKITYDFSDVKSLKNPHSKEVLKIAHSCCEESERDFFFIATLLKEASENTKKDTAEIFSGIKELRDKKILIPIEISAIEAQPISQQEMNLISQKITSLVALSQEEKQKLVNDLAQLGPAEREAYFASITAQQAIVSKPVDLKTGAIKVDNLKAAKKEIKNQVKNANNAKKEKNYENAITLYQNAAMIASNWELTKLFDSLEDIIRLTRIEDSKIKLKKLENEAKLAAKNEKYSEATEKYRIASKLASEIFKLGVTEMTKEVKRLSNKSKEYEKLI